MEEEAVRAATRIVVRLLATHDIEVDDVDREWVRSQIELGHTPENIILAVRIAKVELNAQDYETLQRLDDEFYREGVEREGK